MRPSKYLKKLHNKTVSHFYKIRILAEKSSCQDWPESDHGISYTTIESLNLWANFCRSYFLSCSLLPLRGDGSQIHLSNASIHNYDDAISVAMRRCKYNIWRRGRWDRRDEPPWHQPATLIKCCQEIGCSHYSDILVAFSVPTKVFDHLPKFRNFFAHRNDQTTLTVKNLALYYSISDRLHPSETLCSRAYGRPQILILDWIDDINNTIGLLCK